MDVRLKIFFVVWMMVSIGLSFICSSYIIKSVSMYKAFRVLSNETQCIIVYMCFSFLLSSVFLTPLLFRGILLYLTDETLIPLHEVIPYIKLIFFTQMFALFLSMSFGYFISPSTKDILSKETSSSMLNKTRETLQFCLRLYTTNFCVSVLLSVMFISL